MPHAVNKYLNIPKIATDFNVYIDTPCVKSGCIQLKYVELYPESGKLFLTNVSIFLDNLLTLELYKKSVK